MLYGIYSIRDCLNGFTGLMLEANDAMAMRGFRSSFNNEQSLIFTSPADFDLFKLGEYESLDGSITPCTPIMICSGSSIKESLENEI